MNWINKFHERGPSTLCGLSFSPGFVHAVLVQKTNGSVKVAGPAVSIPFDVDAGDEDDELKGHGLRAKLDEACVDETRVAVVVPPKWVMTCQAQVPDVSGDDLQSFLELQIEQEFPLPPSEVVWSYCLVSAPDGSNYATLAGVPKAKLDKLERVAVAAGLHIVSISLGLSRAAPAAAEIGDSRGAVNLWFSGNSVGVEILAEHGVIGLRWIEDVTRSGTGTAAERGPDADAVDEALLYRELRISLGQLPRALRQSIRIIRVWGADTAVRAFRPVLEARMESLGITRIDPALMPAGLEGQIEDRGAAYAAWGGAADKLQGVPRAFELLPPKVNRFLQTFDRLGTGSNRGRIGIGAAVLLLIALTFWYQGYKLNRLERKWAELEPVASEVEAVQAKIRRFRPWFSGRAESLEIAQHLTQAFPEGGSVWARNLEIRENSKVFCAGLAEDSEALLAMLDELRATPQVSELTVQQVRGERQVQFAFGYSWNGTGAGAEPKTEEKEGGQP